MFGSIDVKRSNITFFIIINSLRLMYDYYLTILKSIYLHSNCKSININSLIIIFYYFKKKYYDMVNVYQHNFS